MNPGTITKVCGGGGWVEYEFSVLIWSKPFPSGLSFGLELSRTISQMSPLGKVRIYFFKFQQLFMYLSLTLIIQGESG